MPEDDIKRGMGEPDHESADADHDALTTNSGEPVSDDQNSLNAGPEGPLPMDDYRDLEKMAQWPRRNPQLVTSHNSRAEYAARIHR